MDVPAAQTSKSAATAWPIHRRFGNCAIHTAAQLGIDAAIEGSYEKALQCLLLDLIIRNINRLKRNYENFRKLSPERRKDSLSASSARSQLSSEPMRWSGRSDTRYRMCSNPKSRYTFCSSAV